MNSSISFSLLSIIAFLVSVLMMSLNMLSCVAQANRTYVITKNSSAQWTTSNPVLANLEIGVERDSNFFKIGNGIHAWNALPYAISAGARGLIIFVSEDPDNILAYGQDGGFKLAAEYFNAIADYTNGTTGASNVPVPPKP